MPMGMQPCYYCRTLTAWRVNGSPDGKLPGPFAACEDAGACGVRTSGQSRLDITGGEDA